MNPALLDSDIVSYYFRGHQHVRTRVAQYLEEYPSLNFSIFTYCPVNSQVSDKDDTV